MYKSKATAETVKVDRKCFAHQGALSRYWVGGMGKKDKKSSLLPVLTEHVRIWCFRRY